MYKQNSKIPPNKLHNFTLKNFAGGLNNLSENADDNQATDLLNMAFHGDDVMERRMGSAKFDTLTIAGEVSFIDEYRPYQEANKLIRASKTELYIDGVKVKDIVGQMYGTNYMGKYVFVDGSGIYVYGKFPQVDALPYSDVIGTPDPAYVMMKVVNPLEGYVPLTTEHKRGVTKYDYTNKFVYYEPCQLEIVDEFKGPNVLPVNPTIIVTHGARLFVSGVDADNDNVFLTDISNPYYFPVGLPLQVPPTSDRVVGMVVYDDSVIVGRKNDLFAITGVTNRTDINGFELFRIRRINSHTGFANGNSSDVANNYLFFLGSDGVCYALSSVRQDQRVLATTIISMQIDLFKYPISIDRADLALAASYYIDDKWYLSVKGVVLVYSYRHRAWSLYNNLHVRSFYNLNSVLIWGNKNGQTCKFSLVDTMDLTVPYRSFWTSKYFDMGDPSIYKQFREFFIVGHTYDVYLSDINLTFDIDYAEVKNQYTIANQMSLFGRAKWGDRFINRNIIASLPFVIGNRGRLIRFTLSCGYDVTDVVADVNARNDYVGRKVGTLLYVTSDASYHLFDGVVWTVLTQEDLNQRMRIYQVNGDYEFRGKR